MKIGTYQLPDIAPAKALKFAKVIYDFPGHKASYLGFCQKLGLQPEAGYPGQITSSLRQMGLTTEEKDEYKTTPLAEQIFLPKGDEFEEAKQTIFDSVRLWPILRDHFKGEIEESQFWVYLCEIEGIKGVDRQLVAKKAPFVLKSYKSALEFLAADKIDFNLGRTTLGRGERTTKRMTAEINEPAPDKELEKPVSVTVSTGAVGRVQVPDAGLVDVRDATTYQIAKLYLKMMAEKLGIHETDN